LEFAKGGFNVIGLANNHSLDCIKPGARREMRPSLAIIRKQFPNIAFHGVSYQSDQLQNVAIQTINGIRVGMVSIKGWAVGVQQLVGNISNRKKIFAALLNAPVDVRILTFHGGEELSRVPTSDNLKVIHEFIADYNGDAVFAHHPHVMQGIELLKKKNGKTAVIFHSLGNFLHDGLSRSQDGMMARIEVTKNGVIADSNSTDSIAKNQLRVDLTRMSFTFNEFNDPAPGLGVSIETPKLVGPINSIKPVNYSPKGTTVDIKVIDSTHN
jgi:poly-gamma-glutamate capsule biosynthesis protein CapA/YwtB (metallophosphatase superfamily)